MRAIDITTLKLLFLWGLAFELFLGVAGVWIAGISLAESKSLREGAWSGTILFLLIYSVFFAA